jgi:hypothetical protein
MPVEGYNVKLKKKEVMKNPVIDKKGNRYFAKGTGSDGTKMSAVMGEEKAKAAIKAKEAKKGEGWD